jgi:methylated-DNA-[protein]-cysteine S-methyltransferase
MKTSFNERCYAFLRQVPKGKVTTYQSLAHALGTKAYRSVGNALHVNPYAPQVPCHRVIKADGSLGGFAHGLQIKKEMLQQEGVTLVNNRVDLAAFGYFFSNG